MFYHTIVWPYNVTLYRDEEIEHVYDDVGPVYEDINNRGGKADKIKIPTKEEIEYENMSSDKAISLEICPAYVPTIRPDAGGMVGGLYESVSY